MISALEKKVEALRAEMIRMANKKGNFVDEEVLAISQKLDQLLVKLQRRKMFKSHNEIVSQDMEFVSRLQTPNGISRPSSNRRKPVLKIRSFEFVLSCTSLHTMQKKLSATPQRHLYANLK